MSTPALRQTLARRGVWALFLIPAVFMAWSAYAMWLTYSPVPFNDQWITVHFWRDAPKTGWLQYLVSQHNEHRIFFPRLVFIADWKWFQARDGLNLVVIGLTQVVGALFFVKLADVRRLTRLGLLALVVALALMFSLMQWENLFWGFQVQFVGVYAAAAWGLYAFCLASSDPGRVRWGMMAAALALLVYATFNMANGVFAGAAMVLAGLLTRQRPAAIVTAAAATALLLAVYLHGYHRVEYHSPPALALQHPGRFVTYVCAYLGNIWWPGQPPKAALTGLVGCAATAAMALVVVRKDGRDPVRASLFGVVLFVGISAASTSLGRLSFGVEQALASRYMTPTAWFWGAQALFWALTLRPGRAAWARLGLALVLVAALARLVLLQFVGDSQLLGTRERILAGASALLGGVEDQEALLGLYPDLGTIRDLVPFMRETRISIFADPPAATVGAAFARQVAPLDTVCHGAFDILRPEDGGGAWRAIGWGWDLEARRPLDRIVMVDGAGKVLGVGLSGLPRTDVKKAVRQVTTVASGWVASMTRGAGPEVTAYGITAAGRACELGRKAWPQ